MTDKKTVAVIGGGSFGTALSNIVAENGHACWLWMRDAARAEEIAQTRINKRYMPDLTLHEGVNPTADLQQAVAGSEILFIAVPSKVFTEVLHQMQPWLQPRQVLVSTIKGIQEQGFKLMSQILQEETGFSHIGVLSGPNLAKEIAERQLTATVIASEDQYTRETIQAVLHSDYFRVYASSDIYGVELGGALKNIYAIAAGLAASLGMGENTKSMLVTRSLAEMSRFAVSMGANPMTFLGLAGVGDLIVTCMSPLSRNYRVGYALGQGIPLDEAVAQLGQVAEGVNTVRFVKHKADEMNIYMPLVNGLYEVLFKQRPVKEVARSLMLGEQSTDVEFVLPREAVRKSAPDNGKTSH